jgi:hypothetical protein
MAASEAETRLAAIRDAFTALRPRVIAAGPWALAEDFGTGPEASWGPREVLAHVAEALPFWQGEMERVIEAGRGTGDGQPFGRVAGDAMRIGILERDRTLPLGELFDRIDGGIARWLARIPTVTAEEATARGLHPRDGEVPATWIRDRYVVIHVEEHVTQLEELLAGDGAEPPPRPSAAARRAGPHARPQACGSHGPGGAVARAAGRAARRREPGGP